MELFILLAMILTNGLLSMSEIAVVSARKVRLQHLADGGSAGARAALDLAEDPGRFLSTIQVGITTIGVLSGAYGEAALSSQLEGLLAHIPLVAPMADELALVIVVAGVTFATLILGELVPKRLGLHNPEGIASRAARPMRWLARAGAPLVYLLSATTDRVLSLLGARAKEEPPITEEEIRGLMRQGLEAGVFEKHEHALVGRVFGMDARKIPAIMTPRLDIVYLDLEDDWAINRQRIVDSRLGRFPLCRGGLGHVVGVVNISDVLEQSLAGKVIDLGAVVTPAVYVPASVTVADVLELFKRHKTSLALVVDEFGEVVGLVTLTDVLEALVGELPAMDSAGEEEIVRRDENSWFIDGSVSLDALREAIGAQGLFPDEQTAGYHTLAGLVMTVLGRIPKVSEHFTWNGYRFEVVDMDLNRVDRVLVSRSEAKRQD